MKVSEEEFVDAFRTTGGSAEAMSKLLGLNVRGIHSRRRGIERRTGEMLVSQSPKSPDYGIVRVEFPEWQNIEIKNGYVISFGDGHLLPGHKSTAHRGMLKLIHELQPVAIVDVGDLLDLAAIGRHPRNGWDGHEMVKNELHWGNVCLEEIKRAGPRKMKRLRTRGNHDQRFGSILSSKVPQLEGVAGTTLEDHLPGWPVSWSIMVNDQLCLTHRWKSGLHGPFNNALWAGTSYGTGHEHKQRVYYLTDLRGDRWGVDMGTLASINWPYFRYGEGKPKNWRAGCAVWRLMDGKLRHPEFLRVIDEDKGLVEFRGKDVVV